MEFEYRGHQYRIKKMNVMQQANLSRKITPLLPPLGRPFMKIAAESAKAKAKGIKPEEALMAGIASDAGGLVELLGPFADGLANMKDEDFEFVMNTCLTMIEKQVAPNIWSPVWVPNARMSQFEEFNELSTVLPMVTKVIWSALGNFIPALLVTAQQVEKPQD